MGHIVSFLKDTNSEDIWYEIKYGIFLISLFTLNETAETYLNCQKDI